MIALPAGCSFAPRCSRISEVAGNKCMSQMPELTVRNQGHVARCFIGDDSMSERGAQ